jgi:hypothetical protein
VWTEVRRSANNVRLFGGFFDRDQRALYLAPHKLIEDSTGRVEIFDLSRDPGELSNLAPGDPALAGRLSQRLRAVVAAHPPRFDEEADARAELPAETEEALRQLGYLE